MAITTYPLNNIEYNSADAELFHCTRNSGVWAGDDDFQITVSGADNKVKIGTGLAWIRNSKFSGKVAALKVAETIDLGLPDSVYPRIDAIVLQFSANENATSLIVKKGTPASSPSAPERIKTESIYELHLYQIRRNAGSTAVTMEDVTDVREDEAWCGVMYDDVTPRGSLGFVKKSDVGQPNGVAGLDESGKVPSSQLPAMNYIPKSDRGAYNGVASLVGGKVPSSQLPAMNYIPTSEKGAYNGVASLKNGIVPAKQLFEPVDVNVEFSRSDMTIITSNICCYKIANFLYCSYKIDMSGNNDSAGGAKLLFDFPSSDIEPSAGNGINFVSCLYGYHESGESDAYTHKEVTTCEFAYHSVSIAVKYTARTTDYYYGSFIIPIAVYE